MGVQNFSAPMSGGAAASGKKSKKGLAIGLSIGSVLIAVSVGIETIRQVEAQMVMRHHKGFLA